MSQSECHEPEINPLLIPPHEEAKIGPTALRHRADILERLLPEIRGRLLTYEVVIGLCFFDEQAKVDAMARLGEIMFELGSVNRSMVQTSFMLGEA